MRVVFFVFIVLTPFFVDAKSDGIKHSEIEMAESAILWSLVSANTYEGKKLCFESIFACHQMDADLGLAYINQGDGVEYLTSLSEIVRYNIDAGVSESYTCNILDKWKLIEPYFKKISPEKMREKCMGEVKYIMKSNAPHLNDLNMDYICSSEQQIQEKLDNIMTGRHL